MGYLFKTALTPEGLPEDSLEIKTVKTMIKLWTSFARNGDPNPKPPTTLVNQVWKPVQQNDIHFLDIGEKLVSGVNPEAERIAFWEDIDRMSSKL